MRIRLKTFVILVFCMASLTMQSQSTYNITGTLKDNSTKQFVPFASVVAVNDTDTTITSGTLSDSTGKFSLALPAGTYRFTISFVGYQTFQRRLIVSMANQDLGTIFLHPDTKMLDEVTIESSNQIITPEKEEYIVTKEFSKNANNVKDLLPKINGVYVDPMTDQVKVDNEPKVLFLVNGNKKSEGYVKNISPKRVARIEINRSPEGRYAVQGYTSVINVILKENYMGHEFSGNEKILHSSLKSNGEERFTNNDFLQYTYSYKKINIYGRYFNNSGEIKLHQDYITKLNDTLMLMRKSGEREAGWIYHNLINSYTVGFDYYINKKHNFSIETDYQNKPSKYNVVTEQYYNILQQNTDTTNYLSKKVNQTDVNRFALNMVYNWKISDATNFHINYGYNHLIRTNSYSYSRISIDTVSREISLINQYSHLNLDFTHTFGKTLTLNMGYNNILKGNDNLYFDDNNNRKTRFSEMRNNFYAYSRLKLSEKLFFRAGASFHQHKQEYMGTMPNHYSVSPSFHVFYKKSKKTNMKLSFSSSRTYPYNSQLNPYEIIDNRYVVQVGNPLLKVATKYRASMKFNFFHNKISFSPYYHFTDHYIAKTGYFERPDKYVYTFSNIDDYRSGGLKINLNTSFAKKKLRVIFSGNLYHDDVVFNGIHSEVTDMSTNSTIVYFNEKYNMVSMLTLVKENIKHARTYGYALQGDEFFAMMIKKIFMKYHFSVTVFYILPIEGKFINHSEETVYTDGAFQESYNESLKIANNLFSIKILYWFSKGKEIKTIKKSDLTEHEQEAKRVL